MTGKADLAGRLAEQLGSKAGAATAVDAVLGALTAALAAGERVTLPGFGTFEVQARPQRTARNPRTGEPVVVPATTVARFRPGTRLRAAVASGLVTTPAAAGTAPSPAARRRVADEPASPSAGAHDGKKSKAKKSKGKKSKVGGPADGKKTKPKQAEDVKTKAPKGKKAQGKSKKKSSRKG